MKSTWRVGVCNGLWVEVVSDEGKVVRAATPDDATTICLMLNQLEEAAAFGWQCVQDRHENAYIEATVVKRLFRASQATLARLDNPMLNTSLFEDVKEELRAALNGWAV